MQISCALHIQSWTPTGKKVSDCLYRQSTTNNRQPTTRYQQQPPDTDTRQSTVSTGTTPGNQQQPPTATPDYQQPALDDSLQPTTNNYHRQIVHPITKTATRQPKIAPTDRKATQPRQGWQRQTLHASFVTNFKPTTTDRQRQTDNAIVILFLIIRHHVDKTTFINRSTKDDGQCRSTNSCYISRIIADSAHTLARRICHIHITEWRWYKCTL